MKTATLLAVLIIATISFSGAQTPAAHQSPSSPIKVTIEGTELDRRMLLEKLNAHGGGHKLNFLLSEKEFDYRIIFRTGQRGVQTGYGEMNSSGSSIQCFDSAGKELFEFNRAGRWTDSGATNAAAKEIVKRLLKLQ